MPGGWIQVDKNLPNKEEVLRIAAETGSSIDEVCMRLIKFWWWVDDNVPPSGRLGLATLDTLALRFGGDARWWRAVITAQWLGEDDKGFFIPGHKKRFSDSARKRHLNAKRAKRYRDKQAASRNGSVARDDHARAPTRRRRKTETETETETETNTVGSTNSSEVVNSLRAPTSTSDVSTADADALRKTREVDWERAREVANRVVRKLSLTKLKTQDRSLLIKAAALEQSMGEHFLWDSVEAVIRRKPENPFSYLDGVMSSKCKEQGLNFKWLLKQIDVPAGLLEPPARAGPT